MAKRCQSRYVAGATSSGEVVLAPYGDGEQAYSVSVTTKTLAATATVFFPIASLPPGSGCESGGQSGDM